MSRPQPYVPTHIASDRYSQLYNNDLYGAATVGSPSERKNALIDAALIQCGADPERWPEGQRLLAEGPTAAESAFLALFRRDWQTGPAGEGVVPLGDAERRP